MCFVGYDLSLTFFLSNKTRRSAMVVELEQFQQDLGKSVRQMKAG